MIASRCGVGREAGLVVEAQPVRRIQLLHLHLRPHVMGSHGDQMHHARRVWSRGDSVLTDLARVQQVGHSRRFGAGLRDRPPALRDRDAGALVGARARRGSLMAYPPVRIASAALLFLVVVVGAALSDDNVGRPPTASSCSRLPRCSGSSCAARGCWPASPPQTARAPHSGALRADRLLGDPAQRHEHRVEHHRADDDGVHRGGRPVGGQRLVEVDLGHAHHCLGVAPQRRGA